MKHYHVWSGQCGCSCVVFNVRNEDEARHEAYDQVFWDTLDAEYGGDAVEHGYDPGTDMKVMLLCDDGSEPLVVRDDSPAWWGKERCAVSKSTFKTQQRTNNDDS